jgi:hypothetical protein
MKTDKPNMSSGKTKYNKIKKPGQSWTQLRDIDRRKEGEKS